MSFEALNLRSPASNSYSTTLPVLVWVSFLVTTTGCKTPYSRIDSARSFRAPSSNSRLGWKGFGKILDVSIQNTDSFRFSLIFSSITYKILKTDKICKCPDAGTIKWPDDGIGRYARPTIESPQA